MSERNEEQTVGQWELPRCCWSCGTWPVDADTCPSCGVPLTPPAPPPRGELGSVYLVRKGLTKKPGMVIEQEGAELTLHVAAGTDLQRPRSSLGEPLLSASVSISRAWPLFGGVRVDAAKWDWNYLKRLAVELDQEDSGLRLLVADALRCGREDSLSELPISDEAKWWNKSLMRSSTGDSEGALEALAEIPSDRYPAKLLVIWRSWGALIESVERRRQAAELLDGVRHASPAIELMMQLLTRKGALADRVGAVEPLVTVSDRFLAGADATPGLDAARNRVRDVSALIQGEDRASSAVGEGFFGGVLRGMQSERQECVVLTARHLKVLPLSVIDDLLERGNIDASQLEKLKPGQTRTYLVARTRPECLSEDELESLSFLNERARRALEAGDREALDALPDVSDVMEYRAIAGLLGGLDCPVPQLPGMDRLLYRKLKSLAACARSKSLESASAELLSDKTFWPVLRQWLDGDSEAPALMEPEARDFLALAKLLQARDALYLWDWDSALQRARECLGVARAEDTRDEALNIMAAVHWQMGRDEAAIQALEQAIKDEHSPALQANIAVAAAGEEPGVGAQHLARLVLEAPSTQLRVSAALRAVDLWGEEAGRLRLDDADDAETDMPDELIRALRAVLVAPMDLDDFRKLVRLMSWSDREWLAEPNSLQSSPHRESLEAKVYKARAEGLEGFIATLSSALRSSPDVDWLSEERDSMLRVVETGLLEDEAEIWSVSLGIDILENKLPMPLSQRLVFTGLVVAGVADNVDPTKSEPKDEFLDMLLEAKAQLDGLDVEDRGYPEHCIDIGFSRLAIVIARFRDSELTEAFDAYNSIAGQLRRIGFGQRVNKAAVREATAPLREFCTDTSKVLDRMIPHLPDEELATALRNLSAECQRLYGLLKQLGR